MIEDFIKHGNLDSLIYVCDDEEEQFLTVKAIMSMTGAKVSSDGHIKLRLRRIHDRYKQQFNGKKIRKIKNLLCINIGDFYYIGTL